MLCQRSGGFCSQKSCSVEAQCKGACAHLLPQLLHLVSGGNCLRLQLLTLCSRAVLGCCDLGQL